MHSTLVHLRKAAAAAAAALALALAGGSVAHAVKATGGEYNTLYAGLGAKGYDVVAYFTERKPVPGLERYTSEYGGVSWRFASREHRDLFAANPAQYAPQYGGFCSWGVAQGKLFDVDPVNGWRIVDGKLYLNFNADIHKVWEKDPAGYIAKAERQWPGLNR
jgi:YHS domain-containing protein